MILNYLKLSFRNIKNHKAFTAINVVGLAIGIAACLMLMQYAFQQHSYDAYHTNSDKIYRLENDYYINNNLKSESVYTGYQLTEAIKKDIPQVTKVFRFGKLDYMNNTMIYKSADEITSHNQSSVYVADKSMFESLDLPFLEGSHDRFDEPGKVIITEKVATKYFSTINPVGKIVQLSGNVGTYDYEVIGVMEDLPENTHYEWEVLLSFPSNKNYNGEENDGSYVTYLQIKENTTPDEIIPQLKTASEKVYAGSFERTGGSMKFDMHPLNKIQLYYPQFNSFKETGDLKTVNILIIVTVIILLIAWFNYINLSTVKAIERAKEIGIRKVLGSRKKHILFQFIIESILINLIAALIAFTIVQISVPLMASYLEFPVTFGLDVKFWALILAVLIAGAVLSAIYPASIMMGFSPLSILSKKITLNQGGVGFRKILVVSQFVISVILIAATMTVYKQVNFMTTADLGMNIQNMIVIKSPPGNLNDSNGFFEAVGTFKNELESNSLVGV
ncbi:MAG: ABC transporter permease, partial [Cyclobacteriaceae bacterium]